MGQDVVEQSTLTGLGTTQLVLAPYDEVDIATNVVRDRLTDLRQPLPVHLTDDQHVDIAAHLVEP